ncbi:GSG2 [Cordylochernes scorpioides]|uniref:non-specific serine/threonine protein kinase n=1 Tax=Cordylochernes scorpioides TaxID=51811 RepID=A0ABY6KIL3_9ARAC|nr:GSG2 [Cordylochernes scorpioides]
MWLCSPTKLWQLENGLQAGSLWTQVACALAVAERSLQFEHRDLHTGNVLVAEEDITIHYCLDGVDISVPSCGVRASIIDFTMARLTRAGFTFFLDVSSDEALFTGKGDYQFDIYRKMRKHNGWGNTSWSHCCCLSQVHCHGGTASSSRPGYCPRSLFALTDGLVISSRSAPLPDQISSINEVKCEAKMFAYRNSWEHFAPYTNVLWLHYLAYQLLYKIDFRHKKASHFTQLKSWYRKVLKFQSAEEFVLEHYVH